MDEVRGWLDDFICGNLSSDGLREKLEGIVTSAPELALDISIILDQRHEDGKLSTSLHIALGNICLGFGKGTTDNSKTSSRERGIGSEKVSTADRAFSVEEKTGGESLTGGSEPARVLVDNECEMVVDDNFTPSDIASNPDSTTGEGEACGITGVVKHDKTVLKGRFVLEEHIATGGMGSIYKARDLRKEELQDKNSFVAIKILSEDFKAHPDALISLQREAARVQRLAHPNIVTVYDFDRDGDTVYMTMEFLDGVPLSELITEPGSLSREQKMSFIEGVARGLVYAHSKGTIHADLKPSNIFITKDGGVKLLDFGISRAIKYAGEDPGDVTLFNPQSLGALTPTYASMEMFNKDENPDPRDDIYGLACVSYELLSGKHPFRRLASTAAAAADLKPPRLVDLNRRQWAILVKSLAFERSMRTPSVSVFLEEFIGEASEFGGARKKDVRHRKKLLIAAVLLFPVVYFVWGTYFHQFWFVADEVDQGGELIKPMEQADKKSFIPVFIARDDKIDSLSVKNLEQLLDQAGRQFDLDKLLEPVGDNAYATYSKVVMLDPGNIIAQEGVSAIAERYKAIAVKKREAGDYKGSLELIEKALTVFPQDEGLLLLRKHVQNSFLRQSQGRDLSVLLALAARQFSAMKLTSPDGDNAYQTYRSILVDTPSSVEAADGLLMIADKYLALALNKQRQIDVRGGLAMVAKGLSVVPGHAKLLKLKSELSNAHGSLAERNFQINKLFQKADRQYNLLRKIVEPVGDNAYETYKEILGIDPENKLALRRMKEVIRRLLSRAARKVTTGNLVNPEGDNAFEIYNSILAVDPENSEASFGLQGIASDCERQARISSREGRLEEALHLVKGCLRVVPQVGVLSSLRVEIERKIEAVKAPY